MMRRCALATAVIVMTAGIATGEWVLTTWDAVVTPWNQKGLFEWKIKGRKIESEPAKSGSTGTAVVYFQFRCSGTENTMARADNQSVKEDCLTFAEWEWDADASEAPLKSFMDGEQWVTHYPAGNAMIGVTPGNKYKANFKLRALDVYWRCNGLDSNGEFTEGEGSRNPHECKDYLDCPGNGNTDAMPHPGYGDPPPSDSWDLTCTPSAERVLYGVVQVECEATGSFDAKTVHPNPLSKVWGAPGYAKYDCNYKVTCTH